MAIVTIDPDGDLIVKITETELVKSGDESIEMDRDVAEFRVSGQVLTEHCPALLKPGGARGGNSIKCMEILLRAIHEAPQIFSAKLEDMWHLDHACKKYRVGTSTLETWFADWYEQHDIEQYYRNFRRKSETEELLDPKSLLYPCWRFDHAEGFRRASHFLVYNSTGHVTEWNPTENLHCRLEGRIICESSQSDGFIADLDRRAAQRSQRTSAYSPAL